jgi:hypothetical protein
MAKEILYLEALKLRAVAGGTVARPGGRVPTIAGAPRCRVISLRVVCCG